MPEERSNLDIAPTMRPFVAAAAAFLFTLTASTTGVDAFAPASSTAIRTPTKSAVIGANGAAFSPMTTTAKPSFGVATTPMSQPRLLRTIVHMGWGPDPIWSSATVSSNTVACPSESCVSLTLTVPSDTVSDFKVPGQYVQVRESGKGDDAKPIFLAIASPPLSEADVAAGSSDTFEFLIKKTDTNSWITSAAPGTSVEVSQVLGGGFPMEENLEGFKYDFPTQNVMLFATGSGIAPLRSAIESGQLGTGKDGVRTARLYYGVRTPDDMPYAERFGLWEEAGVEVVPVVSQPESGAQWEGRTGYVQNALEEDGVPIPRNSGALLCGVKGMCESVKEILTKAGTFEGRVLTNF